VRQASSRNTNIVTESKYTSPLPRTVAATLPPNAAAMPSATGTSMPGARARRLAQAPRKNGCAE
jgi:hypothetical protein